jgi:hypothetical protein
MGAAAMSGETLTIERSALEQLSTSHDGRKPPTGAPFSSRAVPDGLTVKCTSDGATYTRPGSSLTPSLASRTWWPVSAASHRARSSVKPAVMCWQIQIGAANVLGSPDSTAASALGPPSDAAMATTGTSGRIAGSRVEVRFFRPRGCFTTLTVDNSASVFSSEASAAASSSDGT